jgi:hypothetical protein
MGNVKRETKQLRDSVMRGVISLPSTAGFFLVLVPHFALVSSLFYD